ncbi:uncharacterized protein EI90DRAFT_1308480 [Cantharellus anzutake]|uniref:uncharacterized protein n=1 Tax=Cantharellus anzutake TaxID=1750568 RepID=UPI001908761B|nr:uncharacterized protein EI90DRAFT_1308480 [Cantharellus anzutake]KAF8342165.1 hypothetical protein EI90DRAFT_1308480 [Cantharellus anzutake]
MLSQSHQLCVVACVHGHYWRIIRLLYHEYYGKFALEGAIRFMRACQHPFNVHSILSELRHVGPYLGTNPVQVHFPFIASLLWGFTSSSRSAPSVVLPDLGHVEYISNDYGTTVFDITDPSNPRYCFVSFHGLSVTNDKCERFMPLTGEVYGTSYHPSEQTDHGRKEAAAAIESIQQYQTVSYETLKICWPHDFMQYIPAGRDGESNTHKREPTVPPLSLCALMTLPHSELESVPEHIIKDSATVADVCDRFSGRLTRRLLLVSKDGVLDLGGISVTITELTQVVHGIPILAQNTLYLSLVAWSNPEGGLVKVSDLATLQQCFPQLSCVNAIGCKHFDASLISE